MGIHKLQKSKVFMGNGISDSARAGRVGVFYGLIGNSLLAAIKILAGIFGSSYALIADGAESILDMLCSVIVWGGLKISELPPDDKHPYGHGKAEPLSALVVSSVIIITAIGIAIVSLREMQTPHKGPATFTLFVLVGVVIVKTALSRYLTKVGNDISSSAVKADAWHHFSDALTSTAAFIGISIALIGGKGYESADDWAALSASFIIGFNGLLLFRMAIAEIMDTAPGPEIENKIREIASRTEGVRNVEKYCAVKSGLGYIIQLHIMVDAEITVKAGHHVAHRVKRDLNSDSSLNLIDVIIHVEPF